MIRIWNWANWSIDSSSDDCFMRYLAKSFQLLLKLEKLTFFLYSLQKWSILDNITFLHLLKLSLWFRSHFPPMLPMNFPSSHHALDFSMKFKSMIKMNRWRPAQLSHLSFFKILYFIYLFIFLSLVRVFCYCFYRRFFWRFLNCFFLRFFVVVFYCEDLASFFLFFF